ncbi:MAG: adenylosuccinate lyase [Flavobacteriaceae bacterium]|nr:adenylosuccinate lyase [Flavobacteriaceae bacterium]
MNQVLYDKLNYKKAYRDHRRAPALWVLDHPEYMKDLIGFCFDGDKEISTKAIWSLEFVCRERLSELYPFLNELVNYLPKAQNDGQKRTLSYLCELLCVAHYKKKDDKLEGVFTQVHKEKMTEACFDWLINQEKVACEVRAMTALYYLGEEFDWIHTELAQILKRKMHSASAGYKSRARHMLELMEKLRS